MKLAGAGEYILLIQCQCLFVQPGFGFEIGKAELDAAVGYPLPQCVNQADLFNLFAKAVDKCFFAAAAVSNMVSFPFFGLGGLDEIYKRTDIKGDVFFKFRWVALGVTAKSGQIVFDCFFKLFFAVVKVGHKFTSKTD